MWDLLEWVVEPVIEVFSRVFHADRRPDARKFAVGCLIFFLALLGVVGGLIYYLRR